ncbi:aspartate aminotransferase [Scheffersomyces coipomensis]|uniref:aspartate aminotransferase n=1 Tax=Scheffersomyces coipomensis TaxID=1788519 RepID=UPI00315CEF2B
MVKQDDFGVEQFMDKYETNITNNMGETCSESISISQLIDLIYDNNDAVDVTHKDAQRTKIIDAVLNSKLTYGHIRGSPELKSAISVLYNQDSPLVPITEENIVITNGAIGGNFLTFYSIVNPNDKIIVVSPTYQQLSSVPGVFSQSQDNIIPFKLDFDQGFLPDLDLLQQLIKKHFPKLLVINNPNNPTGVVWKDEIIREIVSICQEKDIWIMCDEVYRPLYHSIEEKDKPKSIVNYGYNKTISTGSASKAFSLAGLRIGWIVTRNNALINDLFSKRDYNTISISMIDDILATFALQNYKIILRRNFELCLNNLEELEKFIINSDGLFSWVKPNGGTTCFIKINIKNVDTFKLCSDLAEHGTLCVPGEVFDNNQGFVRIGFGNSGTDIVNGISQLDKWVRKLPTQEPN